MNKYVMYEDSNNSEKPEYYVQPVFKNIVNEYFDITDTETRKIMLNVNEADQSQILTNLTSKLYDNITERVDNIDYGDIPATKGDITKLPNYQKLVDCIDIMDKLVTEYKQENKPIVTLKTALNNIRVRRDVFYKAYAHKIELPMVMYSTITLSLISSVSFMIATCIEFIKTPNQENFSIVMDKVALAKTEQNLLFTNLEKFNKMCSNGDFDKAMDHVITSSIKGVREADSMDLLSTGVSFVTNTISKAGEIVKTPAGKVFAVIGSLIAVVLLAKELIYFFYYSRSRISDFFDTQANLLQMNAYNLETNKTDEPEEKKRIAAKQLRIAEFFRKLANRIAIDNKQSEVKATKDIVSSNKKLTSKDVLDSAPDSAASVLF